MSLNESTVEDAALNWFSELGYSSLRGSEIAHGKFLAVEEFCKRLICFLLFSCQQRTFENQNDTDQYGAN